MRFSVMSSKPGGFVELKSRTLRGVTFRYIIAVTLIASASILAFLINRHQHLRLEEDFKTINLSGRQRMFTQRIALEAERKNFPGLKEAAGEFEKGLDFLKNTRFASPAYPAVNDLYTQPDGINDLTRELTELVSRSGLNSGEPAQIYAIAQKLLDLFDRSTLEAQYISETEYRNRARMELAVLLFTLSLLALEIILIFKPMRQMIDRAFTKMNQIEGKALETARLAMIGETASSIGHEISNPLNVISLHAEHMLKTTQDPSTVRGKLEAIINQANRIARMLTALRTQSRLTFKDPMVTAELGPIINDAIEMLAHRMNEEKIRLEIKNAEPSTVVCRKAAISQVVANLISNAIDSLEDVETDRRITIEVLKESELPVLRILDSGKGVPEGLEDEIFESFITTKPEGKGTGLGLSISKKIMEEHGGVLRLNTMISRSCFELVFPSI